MSRNAVRQGAGEQPPVTTAGTPGTDDDVRTFAEWAARPCFVTNTHATVDLLVLPNEDGCSPTNFLVKLAPLQAVDISVESQMVITSVSLYYAAGPAYSAALVRGWKH